MSKSGRVYSHLWRYGSPVPELPVDKERHKRALRAVEENDAEIAKAFDLDARVVGLRAGTGEGKTEQAVSYAVAGGSVAITLNRVRLWLNRFIVVLMLRKPTLFCGGRGGSGMAVIPNCLPVIVISYTIARK